MAWLHVSTHFLKKRFLFEKFNIFLIAFKTVYTVYLCNTVTWMYRDRKSFGVERIFFEVYVCTFLYVWGCVFCVGKLPVLTKLLIILYTCGVYGMLACIGIIYILHFVAFLWQKNFPQLYWYSLDDTDLFFVVCLCTDVPFRWQSSKNVNQNFYTI